MVATDHAASIFGVALRVTKLNAAGAPLTGVGNGFITNQFISFGFTPEYTEGDEVEQKAADGSLCVYYQAPDVLKRVSFNLSICTPEPPLLAMLVGGTSLGSDLGYAAPDIGTDATPNGIGLEIWSRAIVGGKPAAVNPYWRWVFPWVRMRADGERVAENGLMAQTFVGWGVANANFGTGPSPKDWTYGTTQAYQYARAASAPTITNDVITV